MKVRIVAFLFILASALFLVIIGSNKVIHNIDKENSSGSTIANISVNQVENTNLEAVLNENINLWFESGISLTDGSYTLPLVKEDIAFDTAATIAQYKAQTAKPWYKFWAAEPTVNLSLQVSTTEQLQNKITKLGIWQEEETINNVVESAKNLENTKISAVPLDEGKLWQANVISLDVVAPSDAVGLQDAVDLLNNHIMVPGDMVSVLGILGDKANTINQISQDAIATAIYSAVLQAEYDIVTHSPQKVAAPYAKLGMEATINSFAKTDLQFINTSAYSNRLKVKLSNKQTITVAIQAPAKDTQISIRIDRSGIVQPKTIYRYATTMRAGEQKVIEQGKEGARLSVYRTVKGKGDAGEHIVSESYYPPVNTVIMKSSKKPDLPKETKSTKDSKKDTTTNKKETAPAIDDKKQPKPAPNVNDDDRSGDQQVQKDGYYDKAGNFVKF